jgi:hypothetical protein
MSKIGFSREPAVWIGLLGAIAGLIVNSHAISILDANQTAENALITLVVGVLIRFFVTPTPVKVGP